MAAPTPVADLQVRQLQLQRRRRLLDAMQLQNNQRNSPVVPAGGGNIVANWGDPVSNILGAIAERREGSKIDTEERENAAQQAAQQAAGLEEYISRREGGMRPEELPPNFVGAPDLKPTKPDLLGALRAARMSNDPFLMEIARGDIAGMRKQQLDPKTILGVTGADLPSRVRAAQSGDISGLQPERKEHVIDGQIISGAPGGPYQPGYDARKQFKPPGPIPGVPGGFGQQEDRPGGPWQPLNPPRGTTVNVDNRGPVAFETESGKFWAERLSKGRDSLQSSIQSLPALIQAYELTKTAQTGILSNELILPARRLAQQFGVGPDQVATIADSQTYLTVMAPQVLKIVKELRPASNLDVDFAKAQAAGDLNLQAETLQRAIRLIGADTFRAAQAHQQNIGAARSAYPEQANTVNSYGIELPNLPAGWLEEMPNGQVGANLRVPGQAVPPKGPFQLDPETDAIMRRYLQPR